MSLRINCLTPPWVVTAIDATITHPAIMRALVIRVTSASDNHDRFAPLDGARDGFVLGPGAWAPWREELSQSEKVSRRQRVLVNSYET